MKMKKKIENVALRVRLVVFAISLVSFVLPAAASLTSEITLSTSDGKTVVSPSSNVSNSSHDNWTATSDNTKVATVEMKTSSSTSTRTPEIYVTPVAKGKCTVTVQYGTSGSNWKLTVNVTEPAVPREIEYDGVKIVVLGATDTLVGEALVLTFTESGSLSLPQTFDESRILVVGGGGGSGYAKQGSKKSTANYYGKGGNGGTFKEETVSIPGGTELTITVGIGGAGSKSSTTPTGTSGGKSEVSGPGFTTITSDGGAGGSGNQTSAATGTGASGSDRAGKESAITGVTYASGGQKYGGTNPSPTAGGANTGDGGGGVRSTTSGAANGLDGGSGVVIVRLKPQKVRTPIDVPTATTAFTFDNTPKTCVAAGAYYARGGTYEATNAGDYTATVTPDDDHCWTGGSRESVEIKWTIARRPVSITVVNTNKVEGAVFIDPDQQTYNDPIWTTTTEGLIASDTTELTWDIFRTNACEEVGTYDLLIEGEKKQGNYDLTFFGGKYEICEAPPKTFAITVTRGAGIADITNGTASVFSGAEKSAAIELEAGTETVTLTLAADHMTIPIYKVITNDVTNVTTRVATYAIAEGAALTFVAEEAKVDDPAVTDEQTTAAIIAAIDGEEGEKTHDDAVAKVETITAGEEGERAVEPKDLATWITDKQISSTRIAQSDYVAASVHFDTSAPITSEAKIEFTEIGEVSSDAFTFAFEVTLDGKETPEELNLVKEFVAGCIETTGDLGEGFAGTVDPNRVTIEDGRVKITPDPEKTAEFFKIVIPKDPTR